MTQFLAGLILFFGIHSVSIIAPSLRDRLAESSEIGWKAIYSLVSLLGIVLIAMGYADLRETPTVLYEPPLWLRHVAALLLLPVFVLFFAPYFPGKIKKAAGHPQLAAIKLWAVAHLLVNGTVADVLLFGSFLAWAVADRVSLKRRAQRPLPGAPESGANDVIIIVLGLALYAATVFWLHENLLGVAPFG